MNGYLVWPGGFCLGMARGAYCIGYEGVHTIFAPGGWWIERRAA